MVGIPKKVIERFSRSIPRFQKVLQQAKDRDINEADTVSIINDIFGEVFGYDKHLEVTSEFAIKGTFCDLALKVDNKIQFLIEVKAIGIELKDNHLRQAIEYGSTCGTPWVLLTNGLDWRLYRIRFEQPIAYDIVYSFDFMALDPHTEKDQELLFTLSMEGLGKDAREEYYEKGQSFNKYVIGGLILSEPVMELVRKELRKLSDGLKVDIDELSQLVETDILKREVVEGEEAEAAQRRINKYYKKAASRKHSKGEEENVAPFSSEEESLSETQGSSLPEKESSEDIKPQE